MRNIKLKIFIWFILGFGLSSAGVYYVYLSFNNLLQSVQILAKPDNAYRLVDDIRTDLVVTENSMRSYMMTGMLEYLDDYLDGMARISERLDSIPALGESIGKEADVSEITSLLQTRADLMYDLVELKNRPGSNTMATRTMNEFKGQLSQNETDLGAVSTNKQGDPALKPLTVTVDPADYEKKKLRDLFSRKSDTKLQLPAATTLALEPDSNALNEEPEVYSINYSADLDIEQVRQILKDINKEELQYNARLNKQEMEIMASDRLLMTKVNNIMERIKQSNDAVFAQITNSADTQVQKTSRSIFLIACISLMAGMTLLTILIVDINRMTKYRLQLEQSKEYAEKLATARQRFLANMSHEIRTPLNSIMGFSEQIKHSKDPEVVDQVEHIHSASEHLLDIVNDILDYSKLEFGKVQMHNAPFRMKDVIEDVYSLLHSKANEKGLAWDIIYDGGANKILDGDSMRLKQVIINLCSNAIKFTHQGSITLELSSKVRERYTDFIIQVTDTGIGIPHKALTTIFNDFSQADSSTSRSFGGTGLGLAICKKIVEQQNGKITAVSEEGQGTSFIVEIRYRNSKQKSIVNEQPIEMTSNSLQDLNVLIADDEPFNIHLAKMILERAGAEVSTCADGSCVDELIESRSFDVYLIDLHMPGEDGRFVAGRIRVKSPEAYIIALTADVITPSEELIQQELFDAILYKPYREESLLKIVSKKKIPASSEAIPSANSEKPFSLEEIRQFCGDDEAMLKDIIHTFLISGPEQSKELIIALTNADEENVRSIAHKMYPSFRHFGALDLSDVLKELETGSFPPENTAKLIQQIQMDTEDLFQALSMELQEYADKV